MKIKKLAGFTLAEVLITLGVIGVVAALTLPILINNYQKSQYVTALKKAYSSWNNALKQASFDAGCVDNLACSGIFADTQTLEQTGDAFVKYFNIAKNCKTSNDMNCFADSYNFEYEDGDYDAEMNNRSDYKFTTVDGMSFSINTFSHDCDNKYGNKQMEKVCGTLYIDVNGYKKPNRAGRDLFYFWITTGNGASLYPAGGQNDTYAPSWSYTCKPNSGFSGVFCTSRVIEEGWSMNY